MALIERLDSTPTPAGIITRSDRVLTENERYGDWARKFFGRSWHRTHANSARGPSRAVVAASTAPTQH